MTSHGSFGWTRFYMEFADKLLAHRDDRSGLVAKVREVCNALDYNYLDRSGTAQESGVLPDICPFTTMGTFNRGISEANRKAIAAEIGKFLRVTEPAPDSFDSIPILNNQNSVVFWDGSDIGPLWRVFEDAIRLADSEDADTRLSFLDSYDRIFNARGLGRKLSMGLFWTRPCRFLPLDTKSEQYISKSLGVTFPGKTPLPGREYLELTDGLSERFTDPAFPASSFQELSLKAYGEPPTPPPPPPPEGNYTLENIVAEGCFLERIKLEMILDRLKTKKNLILQGPPGTGKTWLAKKLAFALISQKDDRRVRRFQFHPNLSYEDFIRGFRPGGDGNLNLVDGPFLETVLDAQGDLSNDYVMVIEEINRGNPAQIFGEMLTLLEADKREPGEALRLAHSKKEGEAVHIPPNVYVIGTMNVADRSIALVDLALRRRFAFVDLEPMFGDVWREWVHQQSGIPLGFLTTIREQMEALNQRITDDPSLGPQFRVGHSYVTPAPRRQIANPVEWFTQVVETEIGPLLDEYWFDRLSEAESARAELLRGL